MKTMTRIKWHSFLRISFLKLLNPLVLASLFLPLAYCNVCLAQLSYYYDESFVGARSGVFLHIGILEDDRKIGAWRVYREDFQLVQEHVFINDTLVVARPNLFAKGHHRTWIAEWETDRWKKYDFQFKTDFRPQLEFGLDYVRFQGEKKVNLYRGNLRPAELDYAGYTWHEFDITRTKNEGVYVEHYPDGAIRLSGQYQDNKPVGKWYFYRPDGSLFAAGKIVHQVVDRYSFSSFKHLNLSHIKPVRVDSTTNQDSITIKNIYQKRVTKPNPENDKGFDFTMEEYDPQRHQREDSLRAALIRCNKTFIDHVLLRANQVEKDSLPLKFQTPYFGSSYFNMNEPKSQDNTEPLYYHSSQEGAWKYYNEYGELVYEEFWESSERKWSINHLTGEKTEY